MTPITYTRPEAAKLLHISVQTLDREIAQGKLAYSRIGKRRILIQPDAIAAYLKAQQIQAVSE